MKSLFNLYNFTKFKIIICNFINYKNDAFKFYL